MSLSIIQNYLSQYRANIKSITMLSNDKNDRKPNHDCWCVSDINTFCLDDIVRLYCTSHSFENFASVDAISIHGNNLNLIEFKNSSCSNDNAKRTLKIKISDSIRFIEKIILNSQFIDSSSVYTRYILVFNPITQNEGFKRTNDELNKLAKRISPNKERLSNIENYVHALQLCDEFLILYPDEFINKINDYID